jgi:hypothetical protein
MNRAMAVMYDIHDIHDMHVGSARHDDGWSCFNSAIYDTPVSKTKSVLERQTRYKRTQAQHLAPIALAGKMHQCNRAHAGMLMQVVNRRESREECAPKLCRVMEWGIINSVV